MQGFSHVKNLEYLCKYYNNSTKTIAFQKLGIDEIKYSLYEKNTTF